MRKIRIQRNVDANGIMFIGSSFPSYYNGALTASISVNDPNKIVVKDTFGKTGRDTKIFDFPYTEFEDADGVAFQNAQAVVDYINTQGNIPRADLLIEASAYTHGYYGLLSGFYFSDAWDIANSQTTIIEDEVDTWLDVNFEVHDPGIPVDKGTFDYRPVAMQTAQATGHTGAGTQTDPITFKLEGLDLSSFGNFRASMGFIPDDDEGQFEARLLFQRHSGTVPNTDFSIEDIVIAMEQGADKLYPAEPFLTFFVGDTIDTNGPGDAGTFKFQVKSSVPGVLTINALTLYINK